MLIWHVTLKSENNPTNETLLQVQGQKILKLIDREIKILKAVSHENIIELKEIFETTQVSCVSFSPSNLILFKILYVKSL